MKSNRFVIRFPSKIVKEPTIYHLSKQYDIAFNILMARIMPNEEGLMVVELSGEDDKYDDGLKYLKERGAEVELLSRDVSRDEKRCTSCGACITICPTGALSIPNRKSMEVTFEVEKCVACSLCVQACPPRAMHVTLNDIGMIPITALV